MIPQTNKLSKIATAEVQSLLCDGYSLVSQVYLRNTWYMRLRHSRNLSYIVIRLRPSSLLITKNNKIIKNLVL